MATPGMGAESNVPPEETTSAANTELNMLKPVTSVKSDASNDEITNTGHKESDVSDDNTTSGTNTEPDASDDVTTPKANAELDVLRKETTSEPDPRDSQPGNISDDTTEVDIDTPPTPLALDLEKTAEAEQHQPHISTTIEPRRSRPSLKEGGEEEEDPQARYQYEKLAQKHPKPTDHLSMTIGPPIILFLDLIVPCIIYYAWYNSKTSAWRNECRTISAERGYNLVPTNSADNDVLIAATCPLEKPEFDKDILGYAVISFGFGELYILIARIWRLVAQREECAPLLSKSAWELDATSWVYGVAMIVALIPFVCGSTLDMPELYLYGPAFLMAFLGLLMVVTLIPFDLPVGINSHARGTPLRPFIYYAAEDFIAVDGLQDREFRKRYNERYEVSRGFRRMFLYLTLWWMAGVVIYIGCLSAVIWTLSFHYAFGLSLGLLFSYIIIWACSSYVYVKIEMARERKKFEQNGCF